MDMCNFLEEIMNGRIVHNYLTVPFALETLSHLEQEARWLGYMDLGRHIHTVYTSFVEASPPKHEASDVRVIRIIPKEKK